MFASDGNEPTRRFIPATHSKAQFRVSDTICNEFSPITMSELQLTLASVPKESIMTVFFARNIADFDVYLLLNVLFGGGALVFAMLAMLSAWTEPDEQRQQATTKS